MLSIDVVLADGNSYTVKPLTYKEFKALKKEKHEYARIVKETFAFLEKNEQIINTNDALADSALVKALPTGAAAFLKGEGELNLIPFIVASEGAVGIVTSVKMQVQPLQSERTYLTIPVFNLEDLPEMLTRLEQYNPNSIAIFDNTTFDTALKNPNFFKKHLDGMQYYRSVLSLYTSYHVRFGKKTPEFTVLVSLPNETIEKHSGYEIVTTLNTENTRSRIITNQAEVEMLELLNATYYTLAKRRSEEMRPATFLKDVVVPNAKLAKFITEVRKEFRELNVPLTIHGQGQKNYFSFYPHLDFTQKTTPILIERISHKFYTLADKYRCIVHEGVSALSALQLPLALENTTTLKAARNLYSTLEKIFDPKDIYNSRQKTYPRFKSGETIRNTN